MVAAMSSGMTESGRQRSEGGGFGSGVGGGLLAGGARLERGALRVAALPLRSAGRERGHGAGQGERADEGEVLETDVLLAHGVTSR